MHIIHIQSHATECTAYMNECTIPRLQWCEQLPLVALTTAIVQIAFHHYATELRCDVCLFRRCPPGLPVNVVCEPTIMNTSCALPYACAASLCAEPCIFMLLRSYGVCSKPINSPAAKRHLRRLSLLGTVTPGYMFHSLHMRTHTHTLCRRSSPLQCYTASRAHSKT